MKKWIQQIIENNIGTVLVDEPLSKHTSWKIGGPADAFIIPEGKEKLITTIKLLNLNGIEWKIIGKGSNLLVLDRGFRGAIISLNHEEFQKIEINQTQVITGANVSLVRLANLVAKQGLTGLEFAGGIPGTVGGAIYMNAGAHGSDISKVMQEAEILNEFGEIEIWQANDFLFSYRTSAVQTRKATILSAKFELQLGDRKKIAENMSTFKSRRQKTQPYNLPNAGSVFRNPPNDYAGRLIEELGLKGYQIGGARVSELHANFIVNIDNATAEDVLKLIGTLKEKVYSTYKVELFSEIEIIGES